MYGLTQNIPIRLIKLKRSKERDRSGDYKNLVFVLRSAEDIPYPDDYFDHAVCSESLGFWSEPEKGLAEAKRVLKPGGKLYVINSYKEAPAWMRISVKVFSLFSAYKEKLYSSQEYGGFFQRSGFAVVDQKKVMGTLVTIGTKGAYT
jgi:MPBQ/MSBQ methyltransferase